ncbi:MAG: excinuclease ABC subunit UvrA [Thermomicrobiales bacterium]
MAPSSPDSQSDAAVWLRVRDAREHNLKHVDVAIPRDRIAVFTGVSGSGKSSLAFGTIFAEAQRRYLESVAPYARRLFEQVGAPKVAEIEGLPPAVALQQARGSNNPRSSVGTITQLSNVLRMLFSRAGTYPEGATRLDSDAFSPNTMAGACPHCHGLGRVQGVDLDSMVPDPSLSIREGAIAAWPGAWQGKNYRDILGVLGYDIDRPWHELPEADRAWILTTDETPVVTVHAQREAHRIQRPYQGTYQSPRRWVLHTFATTQSPTLRTKVSRFLVSTPCPVCGGKRLRRESLAVTVGGRDITELASLPLTELAAALDTAVAPVRAGRDAEALTAEDEAALSLVENLVGRIAVLRQLGLGYLSIDRSTTTLSSGELQRLRLATQLRSGLFGVLYVLDEPSAGLHPADTEALLDAIRRLQRAGNGVFVVEHNLDVIREAGWIVDVGPGAGERGGHVLYSGPVADLAGIPESVTRAFLFPEMTAVRRVPRTASGWLTLRNVTLHTLRGVEARFPLGVLTAVTGVSGSGKSTLVSRVLAEVVGAHVGAARTVSGPDEAPELDGAESVEDVFSDDETFAVEQVAAEGLDAISRLVSVDQKPIGRTPRSNLATYTGLFDAVRKQFAATDEAQARGWGPGRFSFNVEGGRCEHCQGAGEIAIEMLFLPGATAPCPVCHGARYNAETLEVTVSGRTIADVLAMTVEEALTFLRDVPAAMRSLRVLDRVGLGYLRLGQPATTLSGGEAQRVKLATELQRAKRGHTLYVLDEPSSGLHPADVELLMAVLQGLVDARNTVVLVEHEMAIVAQADWVIDLGPGGGDAGGRIVAAGTPADVAASAGSITAPYLARELGEAEAAPLR